MSLEKELDPLREIEVTPMQTNKDDAGCFDVQKIDWTQGGKPSRN